MTNWNLPKSKCNDYEARFREIISDPLNLMISRVPDAGYLESNHVTLHNGVKVKIEGEYSYYDKFSKILLLNRGVHEPLEEFVFQELMKKINEFPRMIELGAYWGHYSIWLKITKPNSILDLVEPDINNLNTGKYNFENNDINLENVRFINEKVGKDYFSIDEYMKKNNIHHLDILHSDIQGYELEMIIGALDSFKKRLIDYVFISTHSNIIHYNILARLGLFEYRIEVSSDFENETTSFDGFIFASSPNVKPLLPNFRPLHRSEIAHSTTTDLVNYIKNITQ
ncbi:FkbM family methyltransferase [Prochlorococcus marinus]|uniref:FkbM family methyltransferase n=1 Tax=Prochlorococcus marinus TaxID=1219 RepID=UPI0022B54FA0|nr:FkbM family methyltransferase [Prochlorococcus marinus]